MGQIFGRFAKILPSAQTDDEACAKLQPRSRVVGSKTPRFQALPRDAVDSHVHVFDAAIGPFAASRSYTPAEASLRELMSFGSRLTKNARPFHFVLVQPSPYDTDNTVLLHCLRKFRDEGLTPARGIAVVDTQTVSQDELWAMHEEGVRGLRLNVQADGRGVDINKLRDNILQASSKIKDLPNWKLQLYCPANVWDDLHDTINELPVQVIADHIGGLLGSSKLPEDQSKDPMNQPGLQSLVSLAKNHKVIVKISGLYRASSRDDSGYDDLERIIKTLAQEIPDRLVWASDWPHTGSGKDRKNRSLEHIEQFRSVCNETIITNLRKWIGNEQTWSNMMVHTPRAVYE